jgi:hypothetical protein
VTSTHPTSPQTPHRAAGDRRCLAAAILLPLWGQWCNHDAPLEVSLCVGSMRVCCSPIRRFRRTHSVPMVWRSDRKLAGHFEQLIVQRADKLGGLWGIASIHAGGVAQLALSQTCEIARAFTIHSTQRKHLVTVHRRVADPRQRRTESFPCHERVTSRARRPRILANVLGLKALVVPLKLNSSERRRMLVSGLKIRPVWVRVPVGAQG